MLPPLNPPPEAKVIKNPHFIAVCVMGRGEIRIAKRWVKALNHGDKGLHRRLEIIRFRISIIAVLYFARVILSQAGCHATEMTEEIFSVFTINEV